MAGYSHGLATLPPQSPPSSPFKSSPTAASPVLFAFDLAIDVNVGALMLLPPDPPSAAAIAAMSFVELRRLRAPPGATLDSSLSIRAQVEPLSLSSFCSSAAAPPPVAPPAFSFPLVRRLALLFFPFLPLDGGVGPSSAAPFKLDEPVRSTRSSSGSAFPRGGGGGVGGGCAAAGLLGAKGSSTPSASQSIDKIPNADLPRWFG
mmetsp:Transcript_89935/g.257206  ORF Transcript_89935/g.257206 Transcript_89935/m.257206 type:complete len:204 (-) Transcript_89935:98-709(-)